MSLDRLGLLLAVGVAWLPAPAAGQTPESPRVTAIRAGRLVDVERGEVRRDQLIVVRGDRIEAIHPGTTRPPSGAKVIDLSRYTVLPGLIDCHAHLIGDLTDADALLPLQRSGAQEAFSGVRNARSTLLAGFTTVRDVGTYRALVDAALRDAIEDGTVIGPRMAVAGAGIRRRGAGAAQDLGPERQVASPGAAGADRGDQLQEPRRHPHQRVHAQAGRLPARHPLSHHPPDSWRPGVAVLP